MGNRHRRECDIYSKVKCKKMNTNTKAYHRLIVVKSATLHWLPQPINHICVLHLFGDFLEILLGMIYRTVFCIVNFYSNGQLFCMNVTHL